MYGKIQPLNLFIFYIDGKKQNKKSFLDLGCGLGRHTVLFAANGFDVSAFDISENAIERTSSWAHELGLNINIKQGDMLNIPFDDESVCATE